VQSPTKPLYFSPVRNRAADGNVSFDDGPTGAAVTAALPRWGIVTGKVTAPNPINNISLNNLSSHVMGQNNSLAFDSSGAAPAIGLSLRENENKFNEFSKMLAGININ